MSGSEEAVMTRCASGFGLSVSMDPEEYRKVKKKNCGENFVTCLHAAVVTLGSHKRCTPPDH